MLDNWHHRYHLRHIPDVASPFYVFRTGQRSLIVCDISKWAHTAQATQTGPCAPGSSHQHSFNPCNPELVQGAQCLVRDHPGYHSLHPEQQQPELDKYLLDVFLSRLWSLIWCAEHLNRVMGSISASWRIVGDRKSHFIHDKALTDDLW